MPEQYHVVKSGDTLTKIAKTYNTTVSKLMEINADTITNKNVIRVGQIIRLPGSVSVTEKPVTPPAKPSKDYSKLGEAVYKCARKIATLPEFKAVEALLYGNED